jgi:hypothetical protein
MTNDRRNKFEKVYESVIQRELRDSLREKGGTSIPEDRAILLWRFLI